MGYIILPRDFLERKIKVEKKFKFSDNPNASKIIYGAVIALLCITAIIVGIVAASNRASDDDELPPINGDTSNGENENENENENGGGDNNADDKKPEKLTYISPAVGTVAKAHSTTTPVYSVTLEEWRIHTGIDISTKEGQDVFAAAAGKVTAVRNDPLLGKTVEITHEDGMVSVYSNLSGEGLISLGTEVRSGERIGFVGDTTISELADEPHLHFEMLKDGKKVNPLDYISEDAKRVSLGITDEEAA